jgi:hypothetical protein
MVAPMWEHIVDGAIVLLFAVVCQGTFSSFPRHLPDPYQTTHVGYTMDGLYKGKLRRPLVTYKNKTRTAVQNQSLPS